MRFLLGVLSVIGAVVFPGCPWRAYLRLGRTGSRSESEEQPEDLPDKFESGTPNGAGIAGLGAGIRWVAARGVEAIRAHEVALTRQLVKGLSVIPGVTV